MATTLRLFRNITSLKPVSRLSHPSIRKMATAAAKHEWIVILPDNVGALELRMKVRPDHLEGIKAGAESGFWKMGGAYLEDLPKEGEGMKIQGSVMVALAVSKEEVLAELKKDVYSESGVWDWNKIQIYPFKCAFRNP